MKGARGSILIGVLLLAVALFVGGLALSVQQTHRYRAVVAEAQALEALTLAEAGLEDALVKLTKDPDFPPGGSPEQTTFTYLERLVGPDGRSLGSYLVTIDTTYLLPPFEFFLVTSEGAVGEAGRTRVTRTVVAEIDRGTRSVRLRGQQRR